MMAAVINLTIRSREIRGKRRATEFELGKIRKQE